MSKVGRKGKPIAGDTPMYALRLPVLQREQFQKAANEEGKALSTWIRDTCQKAIEQ